MKEKETGLTGEMEAVEGFEMSQKDFGEEPEELEGEEKLQAPRNVDELTTSTESMSSFRVESSDSFSSFASYDIADQYVACEYEEIPSHRWLSPSFRWISRSYQRKAASRSSSSVNIPEKKNRVGSRILFSFFRRRTAKGKNQNSFNIPREREEDIQRRTSKNGPIFAASVAVSDQFDLEELLKASAEVLGKGTFGTTYQASLERGVAVAVKRLWNCHLDKGEFDGLMRRIFDICHPHVLSPLAFYFSKDERLILSDYIPQRSIDSVLHGSEKERPTWEERFKWIQEIAQGLTYVHSHSQMAHGCLKSSNILLRHNGEACISKLGLFMIVDLDFTICRCYAPLYELRYYTQATDVYAFGVLIFELVLMKTPWRMNDDGSKQVVEFVEEVKSVNGDIEVLIESSDNLPSSELVEMANMLFLGLECVSEEPQSRPSMKEVEKEIEMMSLKRSNHMVNKHSKHSPVLTTTNDTTEVTDDQAPSSLPETGATELEQEDRTMHADVDLSNDGTGFISLRSGGMPVGGESIRLDEDTLEDTSKSVEDVDGGAEAAFPFDDIDGGAEATKSEEQQPEPNADTTDLPFFLCSDDERKPLKNVQKRDAALSDQENVIISDNNNAATETKEEAMQTVTMKEDSLKTSSRINSQDSIEVSEKGTTGIQEHVSADEIFSDQENDIEKGDIIPNIEPGIEEIASSAAMPIYQMNENHDGTEISNEGTAGFREPYDIGIPPGYCSVGPMKHYQVSVMKSLVDGLRETVESGARFDEVMECVKRFTAILVSLGEPLEGWNSLAQYVLHAIKKIDDLKAEPESKDIDSMSELVSTLRAKVEESSHLIEEGESNLDKSRQRLAQAEEHQIHVRQKIEHLTKQIEDLRKEAKSGDEALFWINEEVKLMETRIAEQKLQVEEQKKDMIIATKELELAGAAKKGKDDAILTLIESALLRISAFSCR